MGLVTLPHNPTGLRDGTDDQKGSVVLANDQAIIAQLNGNVDRYNLSPTPAFPGTCLSNVAGERVPTDRIEDDAITGDKLKDDPTTGHAAAAVNLANHVKDGILNGLKLATGTVGAAVLKVNYYDWTSIGSLVADGDNSISTGILEANAIPLCVVTMLAGNPNSTTAKYNTGIHLNTSTGAYHIVIHNASGATVVTTGVTLRFYYIEKAST